MAHAVSEPVAVAAVSSEIPVIDLVQPLPGFPGHRHFALVELDGDGVLCALRSLEEPDLRFLVVPAGRFFPDYEPLVDDDTVAELEITSAADVLVLLLLTAGSSLAESTVNLMAPLMVNIRTRRAMQVLLEESAFSMRAPLVA